MLERGGTGSRVAKAQSLAKLLDFAHRGTTTRKTDEKIQKLKKFRCFDSPQTSRARVRRYGAGLAKTIKKVKKKLGKTLAASSLFVTRLDKKLKKEHHKKAIKNAGVEAWLKRAASGRQNTSRLGAMTKSQKRHKATPPLPQQPISESNTPREMSDNKDSCIIPFVSYFGDDEIVDENDEVFPELLSDAEEQEEERPGIEPVEETGEERGGRELVVGVAITLVAARGDEWNDKALVAPSLPQVHFEDGELVT